MIHVDIKSIEPAWHVLLVSATCIPQPVLFLTPNTIDTSSQHQARIPTRSPNSSRTQHAWPLAAVGFNQEFIIPKLWSSIQGVSSAQSKHYIIPFEVILANSAAWDGCITLHQQQKKCKTLYELNTLTHSQEMFSLFHPLQCPDKKRLWAQVVLAPLEWDNAGILPRTI